MSLGGERHRLFINTEMRQDTGVDVGDRAEVVLEYDLEPGLSTSFTGDRKLAPLLARPPSGEGQVFIRDLLESGELKPVIDRRYPLREVPDALRYLAEGRARGRIVITI